jgi:hypothetical protein
VFQASRSFPALMGRYDEEQKQVQLAWNLDQNEQIPHGKCPKDQSIRMDFPAWPLASLQRWPSIAS